MATKKKTTRAKGRKVSGKKKSKRKAGPVAVAAGAAKSLDAGRAAALKKLQGGGAKGSLVKVRSETEGKANVLTKDGRLITYAEWEKEQNGGVDPKVAAAAEKAASAPLPPFKLAELPVDSITDPAKGGRVGGPKGTSDADEASLAELSRSIDRTGGVLQPIGVLQDGSKRTVIWGSRRFAAVKMTEQKKIACKVYQDLTQQQVEQLRAIENVQRAEWTLVEESLAVSRAYENTPIGTQGRTTQKARCEAVGLQMGKSEPWVLDRLYISRLTGRARDLVGKGLISLQQAREIATVADPGIQEDIAEMAARAEDGSDGMSYEEVCKHTRARRYQLRTVPWKHDVPFAGKPACTSCPHNTANDLSLYSHDKDEAKAIGDTVSGMCMNKGCFEHKRQACEKSIAAGVTNVRTAIKEKKITKDEVTATSIDAAGVMPKFVKESTFVRQAKAAVAPEPRAPKSGGAAPSAGKAAPKSKKQIAKEKYYEAYVKWGGGVRDAVHGAIGEKPGRVLALVFATGALTRMRDLECLYGGTDMIDRVAKMCQSPDIVAIMRAIADGDVGFFAKYEAQLAALVKAGKHENKEVTSGSLTDFGFSEWQAPAFSLLARSCGLKLEPEPDLATFEQAAGVGGKDDVAESPAKAGDK
jgi:hypothetical protein